MFKVDAERKRLHEMGFSNCERKIPVIRVVTQNRILQPPPEDAITRGCTCEEISLIEGQDTLWFTDHRTFAYLRSLATALRLLGY